MKRWTTYRVSQRRAFQTVGGNLMRSELSRICAVGKKKNFVRACPLTNRLRAYRARKPENGRAVAKMRVNPQQRQSPGKTA